MYNSYYLKNRVKMTLHAGYFYFTFARFKQLGTYQFCSLNILRNVNYKMPILNPLTVRRKTHLSHAILMQKVFSKKKGFLLKIFFCIKVDFRKT